MEVHPSDQRKRPQSRPGSALLAGSQGSSAGPAQGEQLEKEMKHAFVLHNEGE
jgi:hypothetical protein